MHRYIYTAITHDYVRGTQKELLLSWYDQRKIHVPDKIIFLNTPPEVALERIWTYRKPSFYECGMDMFYEGNIAAAKKAYKEGEFSKKQLSNMFLEFQSQVYQQYIEMFQGMNNVIWIDHEEPIEFHAKKLIDFLRGEK